MEQEKPEYAITVQHLSPLCCVQIQKSRYNTAGAPAKFPGVDVANYAIMTKHPPSCSHELRKNHPNELFELESADALERWYAVILLAQNEAISRAGTNRLGGQVNLTVLHGIQGFVLN